MKVLITGGAGFIGSNLAAHIEAMDPTAEVRILDDLSSGRQENLAGLSCSLTVGSILDYETLCDAARGVDAIVHLAAIPSVPRSVLAPRPTHDANATGTLNILEAARELSIPYVTVASSSSVYGSNPVLPKSELDWTRPMSPYAVSKLATEAYTIAYAYSYGMKTLAFRFFNVYGPGQAANHAYAAVIPQFLNQALKGEPLVLHGDGLQSRDFTYVETVCAVIFDAISRRVVSLNPVNLAFGTKTSLLDLVEMIQDLSGKTVQVVHEEPRVGDVQASQADHSRLDELFPDIEPLPLETGLARTLQWFNRAKP